MTSRDDLRKSALRAALGITSIRQTKRTEEFRDDISLGISFCKALRTYVSSPDTPPVREPDLFIWDVLMQAVSDESHTEHVDIDLLRHGVDKFQPLLEDVVRGDSIPVEQVVEAEPFLRRASVFLE